jgi:hypothetical protein
MLTLPATLLGTSQPSRSPANQDKPTGCRTTAPTICSSTHTFSIHSWFLLYRMPIPQTHRWWELNSSRPRSSRLRFGMWRRVVWFLVAIFRKSSTLKVQAECPSETPALTRRYCVTPQSNNVNNLVFAVRPTSQYVRHTDRTRSFSTVLLSYLKSHITVVQLRLCTQTRPYALHRVLRASWLAHWQVLTLSRLVFSAGDVCAFAVSCQCGN